MKIMLGLSRACSKLSFYRNLNSKVLCKKRLHTCISKEFKVTILPEDMDFIENLAANRDKRTMEEEDENKNVSKKQKLDKSMEEEQFVRLKKMKKQEEVGPKTFVSAVEMFDFFYNFLHFWPPNLNVNKFEHMVLVELLMQDHLEPDERIGCGIQAFHVCFRPMWKTRCIFLIWDDEFVDDFSFWKCTDDILPLPEDMRIKSDASLSSGGGKSRKRKGGGVKIGEHNHGRGGKSRN